VAEVVPTQLCHDHDARYKLFRSTPYGLVASTPHEDCLTGLPWSERREVVTMCIR
jgi:hypothetical protein